MSNAIILFTRQASEDDEIVGSTKPIARFAQLLEEIELDGTLLWHGHLDNDTYQMIGTFPTNLNTIKLRDKLQCYYDEGAAGFFEIVAFATEVSSPI